MSRARPWFPVWWDWFANPERAGVGSDALVCGIVLFGLGHESPCKDPETHWVLHTDGTPVTPAEVGNVAQTTTRRASQALRTLVARTTIRQREDKAFGFSRSSWERFAKLNGNPGNSRKRVGENLEFQETTTTPPPTPPTLSSPSKPSKKGKEKERASKDATDVRGASKARSLFSRYESARKERLKIRGKHRACTPQDERAIVRLVKHVRKRHQVGEDRAWELVWEYGHTAIEQAAKALETGDSWADKFVKWRGDGGEWGTKRYDRVMAEAELPPTKLKGGYMPPETEISPGDRNV